MQVSVIVPTYNRKALLMQLLESLLAQSASPEDHEIIVVCDGATDGTIESVTALTRIHPHLRLIAQQQSGPAAARNAGAKAARGTYLAFTDDDCIATKNWLEKLVAPFNNPSVVAVEGRTTTIIERRTPLTHQVENYGSNVMPTCNAACRKEVFERIGGFEVTFPFPHNEDADLAWRLKSIGLIQYAPEAWIIHPPRPETIRKKAAWVRYLESEFLLYHRNRIAYRKYASFSPWLTIYWKVFVIGQLRIIKSSCKYLIKPFHPSHFAAGICLVFTRWFHLVRLFPKFLEASKRYQ